MGTKNNPGIYDCYANAEPDEPMFTLLGRDRSAPSLVEAWADARAQANPSISEVAKIREAQTCAESMRVWLKRLGKAETRIVHAHLFGLCRALIAELEGVPMSEDAIDFVNAIRLIVQ